MKLCEPFFKWLKEAEEESEEESENDVAVDFDERTRVVGTIVEPKPAVNGTSAAHESNGHHDEIDIDNI